MDQKLQSLFYSVSSRTAWITIASCVVFWLLCLTGVLTPPLSAPASLTLFWFYAMLMLVLATGMAAIGAAALLLVRRRRAEPAKPQGAERESTEGPDGPEGQVGGEGRERQDAPAEQDDHDQLSGLHRILDDPDAR